MSPIFLSNSKVSHGLSVRINPQHSDCTPYHATPHHTTPYLTYPHSSSECLAKCILFSKKQFFFPLKSSLIWSVFNLLKTEFKLNETERVWSHCAVMVTRVGYKNCQLILYSHITAVRLMRDKPSPCLGRRGVPEKVGVNKKWVNQNENPTTIKRLV
jgi:hypothetical protein